jgi:dihydrofolate reductase
MEAIVAYDINRGISKNGSIPWNIPEDMKFFKNTTLKNVVIMGKNTFSSLNYKPLKDRLNIVITRNPEFYFKYTPEHSNLMFTDNENIHLDIIRNSTEYANRFYFLNKHFKIFYIGGEQIYNNFIPLCSTVWTTQIKHNYDCDLLLSKDMDADNNFKKECVKTTELYDIIKYTKHNSN